MTDGILLREIASDPMLRAYDTLIIDEAHERSLNIDFILGFLKRLLPRRPDLKVIITSATIEPERFARHFATATDTVPIIEVSGRTYPVELRYRPPETGTEQTAAIDAAVATVSHLQLHTGDPGGAGTANVAAGVARAGSTSGRSCAR